VACRLRGAVHFPGFRVPAKGLRLAHPALARGQGCSSSCSQQARRREDAQRLNQRITDQIVEELEKGVPWIKPWSADHMAGRVIKPLRHNSVGYQGINVLALWAERWRKATPRPSG